MSRAECLCFSDGRKPARLDQRVMTLQDVLHGNKGFRKKWGVI